MQMEKDPPHFLLHHLEESWIIVAVDTLPDDDGVARYDTGEEGIGSFHDGGIHPRLLWDQADDLDDCDAHQ